MKWVDSDDNYIEPFSINSVLSARLTMSSKASREERRATARRHFTMSGKPELLPSLQTWLGQRRHPGTVGTLTLLYWLCRKPQSVWNCFIYEGCQCQCLLYLAETCQLDSWCLKFCLQIPVGHNQNQTWDLLGSYQISLSDRFRHSQLTASRKKERGKNWNPLEFPITWNWFLCDHKGFYLVQQSPPPQQQLCLAEDSDISTKSEAGEM